MCWKTCLKQTHENHESVPKVGYKFCLWLVWYGYGWCVIPTLININRCSHMGRCPFQEYQWKVSELYKMTIPEPKNVIFPVTNCAYLAAGAGCWLFVPSTYQCKTVPTKPVEWGLNTAWKTCLIWHLGGLGVELMANNSGLFSGCWVRRRGFMTSLWPESFWTDSTTESHVLVKDHCVFVLLQ